MKPHSEKALPRSLAPSPWRVGKRVLGALWRVLYVAYWLGASESRHIANETINGLIQNQPNDY